MKNKMISRLLAITTMSSIMTGCGEIEPQTIVKEPTNVTSTIILDSVVEDIETVTTEVSIDTMETQSNMENIEIDIVSDEVDTLEEQKKENVSTLDKKVEVVIEEQMKIENIDDYEENDFEMDYEPKEDFDRVRAVYGPAEPTEEFEEFISEDELISYVYGPAPDPEPVPYEPIDDIPVLVYGPAPDQEPIPYDPIDDTTVEVYGPAPYIEREIFE